jgi:hypothetical protein
LFQDGFIIPMGRNIGETHMREPWVYVGLSPDKVMRVYGRGQDQETAKAEALKAACEYLKERPDCGPLGLWEFKPRHTLAQAKAILAPRDITIKRTFGEYKVTFKGDTNPYHGYFTNDIKDAVDTGLAMANRRDSEKE